MSFPEDESPGPYVKAIRLQNFMAFEDTGWIELRPITLLFGKNSSGKSAIIRALRLLKQSLDAKAEEGALRFVSEQGANLGRFHDVIFRGAITNVITFGFRCDITDQWEMLLDHFPQAAQDSLATPVADLLLSFGWNKDTSRVEMSHICLSLPAAGDEASVKHVLFEATRPDREGGEPDIPWTEAEEQTKGDQLGQALGNAQNPVPWEIHSASLGTEENRLASDYIIEIRRGFLPTLQQLPVSHPSISPDSTSAQLIQVILDEFGNNLSIFLGDLDWISPLRPAPQRVYYTDHSIREQWKQQGASAILKFIEQGGDEPQYAAVNHWLQRLGLGAGLLPDPVERGQATLSQIRLKETEGGNYDLNLSDVGFGASQVIPIILQSLLADHGQLIIIEQPELHLHPSAQAELADLFIEVGMGGKARFLIETHSEHLLLRLRRRIVESTANMDNIGSRFEQDDLATLFIERKWIESISKVEKIIIDEQGDIINTSKDYVGFDSFFSDDIDEIARIIGAKRSIRKSQGH